MFNTDEEGGYDKLAEGGDLNDLPMTPLVFAPPRRVIQTDKEILIPEVIDSVISLDESS